MCISGEECLFWTLVLDYRGSRKTDLGWTYWEPFRCLNVDASGVSFDIQMNHKAFRDTASVLSCFGPLKWAKMLQCDKFHLNKKFKISEIIPTRTRIQNLQSGWGWMNNVNCNKTEKKNFQKNISLKKIMSDKILVRKTIRQFIFTDQYELVWVQNWIFKWDNNFGKLWIKQQAN